MNSADYTLTNYDSLANRLNNLFERKETKRVTLYNTGENIIVMWKDKTANFPEAYLEKILNEGKK